MQQATRLAEVYPDLHPDLNYLMGQQDSWPEVKGVPFPIYAERMEDQLSAEAEAASPLRYENDDKENDVINPELEPDPNPLDSISIMPASHYQQSSGSHAIPTRRPMASNAFYLQPVFEASPYGLAWSDDPHEMYITNMQNCPTVDFMRILASSENLPRGPDTTEICTYGSDNSCTPSPFPNLEGLDLRR